MNIIKEDERERIFGVAVALVGDTDFDTGSRLDRRRRADAFIDELKHLEGISEGRARTAIATAYRRIRNQRAQPVIETDQEPENGG